MYSTRGDLVWLDMWLNRFPKWEIFRYHINLCLEDCGMHVVDEMGKKYEPQGETYIWLLAESHCALHTYPEHKYFALDIFTCGAEGKPMEVVNTLSRNLDVDHYRCGVIKRGVPHPASKHGSRPPIDMGN